MNSAAWLRYFQNNRLNRPEPPWHLPCPDDAPTRAVIARSLSHFQLGESGEGRCLLRHAKKYAARASEPEYYEALALFIQEEQEHARLLAKLVERFGGRLTRRHWTQFLFQALRRTAGLDFEVQVLVTAELIGSAYYRLLALRTRDPVLEEVCRLILRDESRHVEFHGEWLAMLHRRLLPIERASWAGQFQILFLAAAAVAWTDHAPALQAVGSSRAEFVKEARMHGIAFLDRVTTLTRNDSAAAASRA